jgi:hypothetical protein
MKMPQVTQWLADVMETFEHGESSFVTMALNEKSVKKASADEIFNVLSHRRFTHLSRSQSEKYRKKITENLDRDMRLGRSLKFFYDLGPGYHASLRPDFTGLHFEPSLGELLALRQISRFAKEVQKLYAPGVKFGIVIDDLCADVVNDVPVSQTSKYLEKFDSLICSVGMQEWVEIVAESRVFSHERFRDNFSKSPGRSKVLNYEPRQDELENVSRFVGRWCSLPEVVEYLQRYANAQAISERMLSEHLTGVRMAQRASDNVFGFRSFAGGDARHQCGEVDLLVTGEEVAVRPVLTTHVNWGRDLRVPIEPQHLPPTWPLRARLAHVVYRTPDLDSS